MIIKNPTTEEIKKELNKRYKEFKCRLIRDGEVFTNSKGEFIEPENVELKELKRKVKMEIIRIPLVEFNQFDQTLYKAICLMGLDQMDFINWLYEKYESIEFKKVDTVLGGYLGRI